MTQEVHKRWTSRKFWTMVVFQAANTMFVVFGLIPVSTYENISYLLLGSYFLANAAQHIFEKN